MLDEKYKEDISFLVLYFKINQARDNEPACDTLASAILEKDADNELAMKWLGKKFFWKAENRYLKELEAYEKKKTTSQYNKLLDAFETVTNDFKTSLNYFTRLYKLYPKTEYAQYLGNLYTRLSAEGKAKYYYDKAK
jgi:hypothetical protein